MTTGGDLIEVKINQMKAAINLLFVELAEALLLFPSGMKLPEEQKFECQDILRVDKSFVDRDDFLSIMPPIYEDFKAHMQSSEETTYGIWSKTGCDFKEFQRWLEKEKNAPQKIFLIFLFTGDDISLRIFSLIEIYY